MNEKIKINFYITTSYGEYSMEWHLYSTDKKSLNRVVIGEKGEINSDEIKDNIFNIFIPKNGMKEWIGWYSGVANELKKEGVSDQDVKYQIIEILFNEIKKQKDRIEYMNKRPVYFWAEFDD